MLSWLCCKNSNDISEAWGCLPKKIVWFLSLLLKVKQVTFFFVFTEIINLFKMGKSDNSRLNNVNDYDIIVFDSFCSCICSVISCTVIVVLLLSVFYLTSFIFPALTFWNVHVHLQSWFPPPPRDTYSFATAQVFLR